VPLAGLGQRVLPGPREVLGDGLQQRALLLLAQLAPLLGERGLRHGRALQRAVRVGYDLDRRHLRAAARALALEERGLLLVDVHLELLLDVVVHVHDALRAAAARVGPNSRGPTFAGRRERPLHHP